MVLLLFVVLGGSICPRRTRRAKVDAGSWYLAEAAFSLRRGGNESGDLFRGRIWCRKAWIVRIKSVGPVVHHEAAVPLVAAAFLDDVDDTSRCPAVLGCHATRLDLDF